MQLGIIEQLTHSTIRIECTDIHGRPSSGTGFFFAFAPGALSIPVIITNKHVVRGARTGSLSFTLALAGDAQQPDVGNLFALTVENFEGAWVGHPDPAIDLAAMPLAGVLQSVFERTGRHPFYAITSPEIVPSQEDRSKYSTMEDVVMIGYPNGIWDRINNLPVIRRGITASHVRNKWNGRDEFLIDVATFPGSSGSPVFLVNIGSVTDAFGRTTLGETRIRLLGINHSVMLHRADGTIQMVDTPTTMQPVPVTGIPNNLGIAVNSLRVLDFEAIFVELHRKFTERSSTGAPPEPPKAPGATYPYKVF
jgi:hypothetical protein